MQHKFLSINTLTLLAVSVLAAITLAATTRPCFPADRPALLSEAEVNFYGLQRAWFSQVTMNGRMTTIDHTLLDSGTFFIVTSNSDIMALDAETGKTLWTRHISNSDLRLYAPSANQRTVAVVCGSEVHVFDRRNGRLLWHQVLPAPASAGCQLTEQHLYVPLIDQRMACFPMQELKAPSPALLELVPQYRAIGYTLDPYSGKVTKTSNEKVSTEDLVISQKGEKKPAPSKRLLELVPEYAKIGMILNPYTGEVREADSAVASWWKENMTETYTPLKGKAELDELLEAELTLLGKLQRQERVARRFADESAEKTLDDEDSDAPYFLKKQTAPPMVCFSFGTTTLHPLIAYDSTEIEVLTWFTDRGYLFFANASHVKENTFSLQYRIAVTPMVSYMRETKMSRYEGSIARDIAFQPAVVQKNLDDHSSRFMTVVGSASGLVFAYDPKTSEARWWQSVGSPINGRLTAVKDKVFVPCLDGSLCCLDSKQGDILWRSSGIDSFIAASPDWLYVKSIFGDLVAVHPKNGAQKTLFSLKAYKDVHYNNENDRIYLLTNSGLVQCLHEVGRIEPMRHTYLPDAYLEYQETDEERRKLIEMPVIAGGIRQPRQIPQVGTQKPPTSQGTVITEDSPFDSPDDFPTGENVFDAFPTTPVTPPTTVEQPQDDPFGSDFGDFDFDDVGF